VEQELIDQIKSGPAGAAIAVCQIRDVYALGQEVGEAFTRAKEALEQLKALPNP
jgi:predicted RNase H-like HicB family nuclease